MGALGFGATLSLRFGRTGAVFDFAGGVLPAGAVLARGSAAMRVNAGGTLVSEAANVARFDHDPVSGALRGLLLEGAATNWCLASEAFDAAAWVNAASSVAANVASSPAGTMTAEKVIESAAAGQHRQNQSVATAVGQAISFSIHAKAAERTRVQLRLIGALPFANALFDLTAKTASAFAGSASVSERGGGWLRLAVSGVADAASASANLNLADASGSSAYAGDGASGLLVWGAQIESGAGATSYVATAAGATASRATDVLTLDWGRLGVGDGQRTVRYGFDDGSAQEIATVVSGGKASVPTTLARARVRRAEII